MKLLTTGALLFSDPSLTAFSLLGYAGSSTGVMSIRSVFKAVSAFRQGHRQGAVQGSAGNTCFSPTRMAFLPESVTYFTWWKDFSRH